MDHVPQTGTELLPSRVIEAILKRMVYGGGGDGDRADIQQEVPLKWNRLERMKSVRSERPMSVNLPSQPITLDLCSSVGGHSRKLGSQISAGLSSSGVRKAAPENTWMFHPGRTFRSRSALSALHSFPVCSQEGRFIKPAKPEWQPLHRSWLYRQKFFSSWRR